MSSNEIRERARQSRVDAALRNLRYLMNTHATAQAHETVHKDTRTAQAIRYL